MKWNAALVGGICLCLAALYYWLVIGRSGDAPLLYMFTFRMFPFADILWTIAAGTLLYRGYQQARID